MLRGVIFDFDGVLVDSEQAHLHALRTVLLDEAGIEISDAEYDQHYLGNDDLTCFQRAFALHNIAASPDRIGQLVDRKWQVYGEGLANISLLPGARDLVLGLHEAGVPLAVASGSRRGEIETLLRSKGLLAAFRGIVSSDDVAHFKPHPEPYLRGLQVIDASDSPQDVVAFEDSTPGMASARAAGLRVIGVQNSQQAVKAPLAHLVIDSLTRITVADLQTLVRGGP